MALPRPSIPLPSRAAAAPQVDEIERHQRDRRLAAVEVYKDVWDDFYRWKSINDSRLLQEFCVDHPDTFSQRLTCDSSREGLDFDHWSSDHEYLSSHSESSTVSDEHDLDEEMSFLTFKDMSSARQRFIITRYAYLPEELVDDSDEGFELGSSYITIKSAFGSSSEGPAVLGMDPHVPHPCYFSCTSTSRNLPHDIQHNNISFSPFEDNPSFDLDRYLHPFRDFIWQVDFIDPDKLIHLESVRRLHHHFGFSFGQIDALHFFVPTRTSCAGGLLWDTSQRDLLRWPGMQLSEIPELSMADLKTIPPKGDMFTDLANGMRGFCPNLNCVQTFCGVHREMVYPELEPIKPLLTSSSIRLKKGNPCGDHCFRYIDLSNEFQLEAVIWENEDDITILHSILQLSPDMLPCDLAIIMRAKCQDVFIYRLRYLPDNVIEEGDLNLDQERNELPVYNDEPVPPDSLRSSAGFSALTPCRHKGPCNRDSGCKCLLEGHHCQRNCWCSTKCAIRWKGCRCAPVPGSRNKTCSSEYDCPCRAAARECDPELCTRCDAREAHGGVGNFDLGKKHKRPICNNACAQRAIYPLIEIKRGSWGLGAFTTQTLRASQPVGEYVGEILPLDDDIHDRTVAIVNHTGLNYKFDLNKAMLLDSMYVGNEMRYLNHEGPKTHETLEERGHKRANCSGKVVYVNNEHRIMFHTERRIEAGSELFIDYGVEYWTSKDEWDIGKVQAVYWR